MNKLLLISITLLLFLSACSPERQEIYYGEEECSHCSMIISEPRFAGQLLTSKGRHFNFDAIECMVAFIESETTEKGDIHSIWVPGFNNEAWIPADEAHYLRSDNLQSPMSMNLSAYQDLSAAEEYRRNYTGEVLTWNDVQNLIRQEWIHRQ